MSTLHPRIPYSSEEIKRLYPEGLALELVQILLRHGERSPISSRFQNAGLPPYWPYCNAARHLSSFVMTSLDGSQWDDLKWRRRLETFGPDGRPMVVPGVGDKGGGICIDGELTDKGRETTLALRQCLRQLYVDQLGFMPKLLSDSDIIYVRSTLVPRALESVQQALWGLYPLDMRTPGFPPLTITMRIAAAETLYPNDKACRRLAELSRAFAQRAAKRWNDTEDMKYVNDKIGKWMPANSKVAVDSRPRLSGIMDTIKTSLAHGPATRLPEEFYDKKLGNIINRIVIDEWFQGFSVLREYRMLGVGSLAGDILSRMIDSVEGNQTVDNAAGGGDLYASQSHSEEKHFKFALLGCHDTTIGGMLASLGCLDGDKWPPFTSCCICG